ncbi:MULTISPECIES: hypothetical protein [Priestia]|jgi:hypothetical protein|uniref:hypothetical protein n=1 Tax=Priestia TaxID=2800373 RepID=UPI00094C8C68|nr:MULTISPECIES: hypothetical protein [Priestia]MBY0089424.1 hypothetical protein [Priestia aryabhattai]MBY0100987.1 hypothetical protein [Priestia aryabhattai]MCM3098066.1 hypothetical protein [Priestia megaterium]MCM3304132.1 hypothetical protein [Priestia megaterium]OLO28281.1 hypothetical protein BTA37_22010 [Priestia megaterium]
MNNHALIEQIVVEVLKRLDKSDKQQLNAKPKLLIVKESAAIDPIQIKKLETSWTLVYSDDQKENLPKDIQGILFAEAKQDLLVKGALGITDTLESYLLAEALLEGISVSLIPSVTLGNVLLSSNQKKRVNNKYAAHLIAYKNTLESFGVKIQSFERFLQSGLNRHSLSFTERVLTQRHVKLVEEEKITVSPKTIITPLARDTARELGKEICVIDVEGADVL